jgi:hypothetical protein
MNTNGDGHAEPYFIAMIPRDAYQADPAAVLHTLGQLVESSMTTFDRQEVGDLLLVLVPPGTGRDTSQKIGQALSGSGLFGMPGGPPA